MARKRKPAASRDAALRRAAIGAVLGMVGLGAGALLGLLAVGDGLRGPSANAPDFSGLSSNPDALVADTGVSAEPCPGCADSYGVGERLRAERDRRMSEPFRELGAVDVDVATPSGSEDDDYRYGGRFPDPDPPHPVAVPTMVLPVALSDGAGARPVSGQQKGPDDPPGPSTPPR